MYGTFNVHRYHTSLVMLTGATPPQISSSPLALRMDMHLYICIKPDMQHISIPVAQAPHSQGPTNYPDFQ
jgi:hypothetical protein